MSQADSSGRNRITGSLARIEAEFWTAWRTFFRRRTAVFFTFFFPVLIIAIFGVLVQTAPGDSGLFAEPSGYYVPAYLAVVVLLTPLSRIGSTVARQRDGNRFEKLSATPLTRGEWLLAQTAVNVVIITLASLLILALIVVLVGARITLSPLLLVFVVVGVTLFCAVGALIGRGSDSQDGVIAIANTVGFPLLLLSETFVPLDFLPAWFRPVVALSPLTYFARGVRAVTYSGGSGLEELALLSGFAVVVLPLGAYAIPWRN